MAIKHHFKKTFRLLSKCGLTHLKYHAEVHVWLIAPRCFLIRPKLIASEFEEKHFMLDSIFSGANFNKHTGRLSKHGDYSKHQRINKLSMSASIRTLLFVIILNSLSEKVKGMHERWWRYYLCYRYLPAFEHLLCSSFLCKAFMEQRSTGRNTKQY